MTRKNQYSWWHDIESKADKDYQKAEKEYYAKLKGYYKDAMTNIQKEIDSFYAKYAHDEKISIAEAKRRVSKVDIDAYSRRAKKYVKEKNFSEQANAEMRLYNATMKINRLEYLKAQIGLENTALSNEFQALMQSVLKARAMQEFKRMSGILGGGDTESLKTLAKMSDTIANQEFYGATSTDRIWKNHDLLKAEIEKLLVQGFVGGLNGRQLGKKLEKAIEISASTAETLMRTELARVQSQSQLESFNHYGYEEYQYHTLEDRYVCPICADMDKKIFKTADAIEGETLPPLHPRCRCSISAHMDDDEFYKWLNGSH